MKSRRPTTVGRARPSPAYRPAAPGPLKVIAVVEAWIEEHPAMKAVAALVTLACGSCRHHARTPTASYEAPLRARPDGIRPRSTARPSWCSGGAALLRVRLRHIRLIARTAVVKESTRAKRRRQVPGSAKGPTLAPAVGERWLPQEVERVGDLQLLAQGAAEEDEPVRDQR